MWCSMRTVWPGRGKNSLENSSCNLATCALWDSARRTPQGELGRTFLIYLQSQWWFRATGTPLSMVSGDWGDIFEVHHLYLFTWPLIRHLGLPVWHGGFHGSGVVYLKSWVLAPLQNPVVPGCGGRLERQAESELTFFQTIHFSTLSKLNRGVRFKFMLLGVCMCVHLETSAEQTHTLSLSRSRDMDVAEGTKRQTSKLELIKHRWESSRFTCRFDSPPLCPQLTLDHAPVATVTYCSALIFWAH